MVEKLEFWQTDAACEENAILGADLGATAGKPEIRRRGVGKPDRFRLAGVMETDLSEEQAF